MRSFSRATVTRFRFYASTELRLSDIGSRLMSFAPTLLPLPILKLEKPRGSGPFGHSRSPDKGVRVPLYSPPNGNSLSNPSASPVLYIDPRSRLAASDKK